MSLHLVVCDETPDPLEPTVCQACKGEQVLPVSAKTGVVTLLPCLFCCCEVCGEPTSTPPLCADCDKEQDRD
jgi:hypothetical protein